MHLRLLLSAVCVMSPIVAQNFSVTNPARPLMTISGQFTLAIPGQATTVHQYVESDFSLLPPIAQAPVCLVRQGSGWIPRSNHGTASTGSGQSQVTEELNVNLSSDGIYQNNSVRMGAVETVNGTPWQGTRTSVVRINLNSGLWEQSTQTQATGGAAGGSSDGRYDLTSTVTIFQASQAGCSADPLSVVDVPLSFLRIGVSIDEIVQSKTVTGIASDGFSAIALVVATSSQSPVTFSLTKTIPASPGVRAEQLYPVSAYPIQGTWKDEGTSSVAVTPLASATSPSLDGSQSLYAIALLRAPDTQLISESSQEIHVAATQDGNELSNAIIKVSAPPLLLIHGVWANRNSWAPLESYFNSLHTVAERGRVYSACNIQRVDYSVANPKGSSNAAVKSFKDPKVQEILSTSIATALSECRSAGIVASRVDVVGHSKGGLVTREFAGKSSSNLGLLNKVITVGTPHLGSRLANVLIDNQLHASLFGSDYCTALTTGPTLRQEFLAGGRPVCEGDILGQPLDFRVPCQGAVVSLEDQSAMDITDGSGSLHWFAIHGIAPAVSPARFALNQLLYCFVGPMTTVDGTLGPGNDTIVSANSQIFGADTLAEVSGVVHAAIVNDTSETGALASWQQILSWLQGGPTISSASTGIQSAHTTNPRQAEVTPLSDLDLSKLQLAPPNAFQLSPASATSLALNVQTNIRASSSTKTISRILFLMGLDGVDVTAPPFQYAVNPVTLDPISMTVIALFTDNTYSIQRVTYTIHAASNPTRIFSVDTSVRLPTTGSVGAAEIQAQYDTANLNVTPGAAYAMASGTTRVASVAADGTLTAAGPGGDFLRVTFGGHTVLVPVISGGCVFRVPGALLFIGSQGGQLNIALDTTSSCQWTASPDASWITAPTGIGGTGGGSIRLQIGTSIGSLTRSGKVLVGDQAVTIIQAAAGCTYNVAAAFGPAPPTGTRYPITVTAGNTCLWIASSDANWLVLDKQGAVSGTGQLSAQVTATPGPARTGHLFIAGQTFTIQQSAAANWIAPSLVANGTVNAASFSGGPVAPGEIVTIFGTGMGPFTLANLQLAGDRVTTTLAGTRVLFDGTPAPIIYAAAGQLSCIVPYVIAGKSQTSVQVEYLGVASPALILSVTTAAPALFTLNSSGSGPGAILNQDGSVNGTSRPTQRGSIIVLFATGEGQTSPPGVDGLLAVDAAALPKPILPITVTIGNQPVEILYAGAAPGLVAGVMQVNVRVPESVASGSQAVVIRAGTLSSPSTVTVAVQ